MLYQEWLDHTKLINGRTLVWYFDFDENVIKTIIL